LKKANGSMERRALLAFVISLLILLAYQELMKLYYPAAEQPVEAPRVEPTLAERPPREIPAPSEPETVAERPPPEGRDVVIETDLFRAVFTTAGARLKHFALHRYRTRVDPESPPLDLIVNGVASDLPLGVELRGSEKKAGDAHVDYRADRDRLALTGASHGSITFTGEADGVTIVKRFEAQGDRYLLGMSLRAEGAAGAYSEMALGWDVLASPLHLPGQEVLFDSLIAIRSDKLEHHQRTGIETLYEKDIRWFGHSGRYFLALMVPESKDGDTARMWVKRRNDWLETKLLFPAGNFNTHVDLYIGPKEIRVLEAEEHGLRRAVDLGWFTFVALPLLQAMKLSHRVTGNYGFDIILLTVVIKILFIPLTRSSFRSMREMQKLQPQMVKIRERLKDKPDEMNKEIMELYRRHKVNPLGGCLPMLLQVPVFIGLYNALLNAVELRHAPFVGWIRDLSAPDRLGSIQLPFVEGPGFPVLTLLMGASMFVQQWMTPMTTADPTQQRIMLIMPVVFTFMFINFPSGLTLYWLVNNILTIGQQYMMTRPER
jgi:YidC/Oxa1 family membrane protein insertase